MVVIDYSCGEGCGKFVFMFFGEDLKVMECLMYSLIELLFFKVCVVEYMLC